jgi:hypothetical protein
MFIVRRQRIRSKVPIAAATALATVGSLAAVAYALLGRVAVGHIAHPTEFDRVVGWRLWWFIELRRYNPRGQALCRAGGFAFAIGAASWGGWFILRGA